MIKMNGHSVVFGQLVQKLEQITPNTSTLQDDQNEWLQCSIWIDGSKVGIFLGFTRLALNSRTKVNIRLMWKYMHSYFEIILLGSSGISLNPCQERSFVME